MTEKTFQAVVTRVVLDGAHGPYAVARSKELGLVTYSLEKRSWREEDYPEKGMIVVLEDLRKKPAGWRAQSGRYLRPADEEK